MYVPVIANSYYFAIEIAFANSAIYVYDFNHSYLTQAQLKQILEPMAVIFPMIARYMMIRVDNRLAIVRDMMTARQGES